MLDQDNAPFIVVLLVIAAICVAANRGIRELLHRRDTRVLGPVGDEHQLRFALSRRRGAELLLWIEWEYRPRRWTPAAAPLRVETDGFDVGADIESAKHRLHKEHEHLLRRLLGAEQAGEEERKRRRMRAIEIKNYWRTLSAPHDKAMKR